MSQSHSLPMLDAEEMVRTDSTVKAYIYQNLVYAAIYTHTPTRYICDTYKIVRLDICAHVDHHQWSDIVHRTLSPRFGTRHLRLRLKNNSKWNSTILWQAKSSAGALHTHKHTHTSDNDRQGRRNCGRCGKQHGDSKKKEKKAFECAQTNT